MDTQLAYRRDLIGAALVVVLGIVVIVVGRGYDTGTLTRMGAGFVPVVLGVLLIVVGALMALTTRRGAAASAAVPSGVPQLPHQPTTRPEWCGWGCILGGVAAFVVLGTHGGLVPATFAAVFVSALGDRTNSLRDAALLAAGITIAGVLIFSLGLKLSFPLFTWG